MELVPKAEFTIVTRSSSSAWIPELIVAAGPEVTETYIDFFTSTKTKLYDRTKDEITLARAPGRDRLAAVR